MVPRGDEELCDPEVDPCDPEVDLEKVQPDDEVVGEEGEVDPPEVSEQCVSKCSNRRSICVGLLPD